jgi:Zn-dependent membrane protease YugP
MWFPDYTWLIILPALFFALWAQNQVRIAYQQYARVRSRAGVTGAQAARYLLDSAGLYHIQIQLGRGQLTDHYDPRQGVIRLSPAVYHSSSLAALGIAAHETGHAIQHSEGYFPLAFRNNLFPVANLGSQLAMPLFVIGFIFSVQGAANIFMDLGIILFAFGVLFHLVTLPVEFNASQRAVALLAQGGLITSHEVSGTRKVLNAAALTYVASAAVALTQLLRLLMLRDRRN